MQFPIIPNLFRVDLDSNLRSWLLTREQKKPQLIEFWNKCFSMIIIDTKVLLVEFIPETYF